MQILGYKNIPRLIMFTTITIILLNTILISLFYYKNELTAYENNLIELRYKNIENQKKLLKSNIKKIISMIEYKYNTPKLFSKQQKKEIKEWISSIKFDTLKSDYIFVYELLNPKGGKSFAKLLVNPNRKDLLGKIISSEYEDSKGFKFRKNFLKDINKKGESFIKYHYGKTDGTKGYKISYFYYYKPLNWIISKGIHLEDIEQNVQTQKNILKIKLKKQINQNLFFFIFFSVVAIITAYIIGLRIQEIIRLKDKNVKKTQKRLTALNKELDKRIKLEVEKNKEKEKMLVKKSKFIALGEMISLIAHQWRQPISELNAIILNVKLHFTLGKADQNFVDEKTKDIENLLEYMSTTIDDFRTFFKPNKDKKNFYFKDSLKNVFEITSAMFEEHQITLETKIDPSIYIYSYQNEFKQVILSLISNAKDALIKDKIASPKISVNVYKIDNSIKIELHDNAKGIDKLVIDKIFEPYFTTKAESEGTGIGLYMSKMIIEQNMDGVLNVKSDKNGSCFTITFDTPLVSKEELSSIH